MRGVLFVTCVVLAVAEPRTGPGVRNGHAMAYDDRRGATVLFGGADASSVKGDTWAWDGRRWTALTRTGPSPRTFPAMAWDAARGEMVLFGGRRVLFGRETDRDTCLADTWVLRADGWQRHTADPAPAPRAEAGIAYDGERRVIVLYGGYTDRGAERSRLGDTWEWNGEQWRLRTQSGPEARSGIAMAYDERLRRVVLFGGSGGPRRDTWTWDGHRWQQVDTPPTAGRFNSLAAFDSSRRELVRTTGWDGRARVRETWLFDGAQWVLRSSSGPSARNHSALAFDRRRGRMVLFGGHDGDLVFGDTWEWDGRGWHERARVRPQPRVDNGH